MKEAAIAVRQEIVKMTSNAKSGHLGGSLSCVDILVALYFHYLKHNPQNPSWPERDRFVLSKGHAAPAFYATLALSGYFPREDLKTFRDIDSRLQGHPDNRKTLGVEVSTGSLGQGLSVAVGMALGFKLAGKNNHVYALVGDGELDEGEIWEAAMFASHHKIVNITVLVDVKSGLVCSIPVMPKLFITILAPVDFNKLNNNKTIQFIAISFLCIKCPVNLNLVTQI